MSENNPKNQGRRKTKIILIIAGAILIVLVSLRIALPSIVLQFVNSRLQDMSEYTGKVEEIDIRLFRCAYVIKDLVIDKTDEDGEDDTIHFFQVSQIDLSMEWASLFKGKIAGRIRMENPVLNYTAEIHKDKEIKEDTADFRDLLKSLMPLTVNRFEVRDGQIHFVDINAQPVIDIAMRDLYVTARNLTNVVDKNEILPAKVSAAAELYGGNFILDLNLDPLKKNPTFDMKTELRNMNLPAVNEFFNAYGNIEVEQGTFSLYAEFAGKEGNFGGYVKPFINDFKIKKYKENEDLKQRLWELIVGTAMKILENPKSDHVATKIPVNGQFNDAEINVWQAIHYVLRNAFVQGLKPAIENTISVNRLNAVTKKTLMEKIFDGGKKDEKDGKDEKDEKREEKKD